jgi:hypothetical protein
VATSIASALAFNFFHIPPAGRLAIADVRNWVALAVFLAVALLASSVAELARARSRPSSAVVRPTSPPRWRACSCAPTTCAARCPPPRIGSPTRSICPPRASSSRPSPATTGA